MLSPTPTSGRSFAFIVACASTLGAQTPAPPQVAPATVIRVPSASLDREIAAAILLPSSYARSTARYPVLYLLHGGGQDHTAFAARPWFAALQSRDVIIVTPDGGSSWYVNGASEPAARYEDLIIKDVIAYVDTNYRTIASRDGRAIAGVSMGAWGAALLGLKHHQLFGSIGAMSAPFGISRQDPNMDMTSRTQQRFGTPNTPQRRERDPGVLAAEIAPESLPLLFLACGSQDLFVRDNRAFVQRLAERKLPYEYREISPFGHAWEVWDGQLVNFIELMLPRWQKARER
jgi:S-formylglutathione hydrolase FrmB